jgi:hypothetical protein
MALTRFIASGEYETAPVSHRGTQKVEMRMTAAATDVAYDLSTITDGALGTFWTAVGGTAPGTLAMTTLRTIVSMGGVLIRVGGDFAQSYLRAAATGSGAYTQAVTANLPDIEFNASNGPTSMVLVMEWSLPDTVMPITLDLSV